MNRRAALAPLAFALWLLLAMVAFAVFVVFAVLALATNPGGGYFAEPTWSGAIRFAAQALVAALVTVVAGVGAWRAARHPLRGP